MKRGVDKKGKAGGVAAVAAGAGVDGLLGPLRALIVEARQQALRALDLEQWLLGVRQ